MWWILWVVLGIVGLCLLWGFIANNYSCEYCGRISFKGSYNLCPDCLKLENDRKIFRCQKCYEYFNDENPCRCIKKALAKSKVDEIIYGISPAKESKEKNNSFDLNCFICGSKSKSNNKHLCLDCYKKYKDHTVILKLEGGKKVTVEEKYYEGARILTADGHNVRSDGERAIDNFFYHRMIPHSYEKPIYLDKNKYKVESITPDFYLPRQNAYVEFLGYSGPQYVKENEFKRKIYIELGLTVIYLYRDDKDTLDAKLDYYLKNIQPGKLNHIRLDGSGKMII